MTGASLLLLSAAAGIASFFSPCSFPLAVTLVARETSPGQQARVTKLALSLGLGALLFLILAGALIAAGAGAFFKQVTFTSTAGITIRAVVGSLLILLGLIQLNVLPVSLLAVEEAAKPFLARQARLRASGPGWRSGCSGSAICSQASAERARSWPVWPRTRSRRAEREQRSSRSSWRGWCWS